MPTGWSKKSVDSLKSYKCANIKQQQNMSSILSNSASPASVEATTSSLISRPQETTLSSHQRQMQSKFFEQHFTTAILTLVMVTINLQSIKDAVYKMSSCTFLYNNKE